MSLLLNKKENKDTAENNYEFGVFLKISYIFEIKYCEKYLNCVLVS